MKLLKKLITKPQIFKRTIGLSLDQFKMYAQSLTPIWRQAEQKRKLRATRYRKIGGGRQYNCKTIEEMLAIVFLYYKSYWTQEFIGALFDLDQSNVSRLLKKMLPLIEKAADPELAVYLQQAKVEFAQISPNQRINNWRDFLEKHPDLREVSIDATEQQCYRSSDYQTQKLYYSGKQKCHSLKTQIAVSVSGRILDVSETVPGSMHDKKLIDAEETIFKFPQQTVQRLDSGYQGLVKSHPKFYIITPHKKPHKQELSPLAKELNKAHSKRRVIVENVLSRIKKFRILSGLYRGDINDYNQVFRNVAALNNLKLATRMAVAA